MSFVRYLWIVKSTHQSSWRQSLNQYTPHGHNHRIWLTVDTNWISMVGVITRSACLSHDLGHSRSFAFPFLQSHLSLRCSIIPVFKGLLQLVLTLATRWQTYMGCTNRCASFIYIILIQLPTKTFFLHLGHPIHRLRWRCEAMLQSSLSEA